MHIYNEVNRVVLPLNIGVWFSSFTDNPIIKILIDLRTLFCNRVVVQYKTLFKLAGLMNSTSCPVCNVPCGNSSLLTKSLKLKVKIAVGGMVFLYLTETFEKGKESHLVDLLYISTNLESILYSVVDNTKGKFWFDENGFIYLTVPKSLWSIL